MVQEKSEQIFFAQPKVHQFKFADLNKMVPMDPLKLIAFIEQCQVASKAASIFEKIAKDKKQPKEKKTAHLPIAHSRELSYQQHCCHKYCNYHQSNQWDCDDRQLLIEGVLAVPRRIFVLSSLGKAKNYR